MIVLVGSAELFTSTVDKPSRRHWAKLGLRIARLLMCQPEKTSDLVFQSYDRIAAGYDQAWTDHMRDLSLSLADRLAVPQGAECIDLACGTGFLTAELARRSSRQAIGVDASSGMLAAARRHQGRCQFVHADAMAYLRARPARSADVITCGWALGYTRPFAVIRQIVRVLRPGGRVGIIDNSLFSLAEVLWAAMLTFAERPEALRHVIKVRFLPSSHALAAMMHACGLSVRWRSGGSKTYWVPDGQSAIDRLTATGAAAGFEFATDDENRQAVFDRFAEIIEQRHRGRRGVAVTHRYLAAIGEKPC